VARSRSALLAEALTLASRGWPVFPCRPRAKEPLTGHGFKDATTDPGQIEAWWDVNPEANIGIATGAAGLLVLDVDPRHGGDESLHALERTHGELPLTPRQKTGGGGEHFLFRNPNGIGCSAGKLGQGLDVKAKGGYILVSPSRHPSGRPYGWDVSPADAEPVLPPRWLTDLLRAAASRPPAAGVGEPIPTGRRDSTLLSLAGSMRRVGMSAREMEAALLVVNRERCQPPIDERKVRELAERAGGYPAGSPRLAAPEAADAAQELSDLLALPSIGVAATGCRIVGTGRDASADLFLSDGRTITFTPLRLAMSATTLMEVIVSTVGAEPALKNPAARHAVALMRKIGQVEETVDADATATGWGRDFLEAADVLDVDMSDQGQRWAALSRLRAMNPPGHARAVGCSVAKGSVVLRDLDGTLYVRTGWFKAHVHADGDHLITPAALATAMQRVGWKRPGTKGQIKATRPDLPGSLAQTFYVVPRGWDDMDEGAVTAGNPSEMSDPGNPVMPGNPSNARVPARASEQVLPSITGLPGEAGG
jgi:hypothetical protein